MKNKFIKLFLPIVTLAMVLGTGGLKEAATGLFAEDNPYGNTYVPYASVSDNNVNSQVLLNPPSDINLPAFTFLIPGLGSYQTVWSNDLEFDPSDSELSNRFYLEGVDNGSFCYDEDSVIAKIEEKTGGNVYVADCYGDPSNIDCHLKYYQKVTNYGSTYYGVPVGIKNISLFDPQGKHSIVVFSSNYSMQSFENEYRAFEKIANRLCLDYKAKHGYMPKVNLIGHSRGGLVAQEYANNYPRMVSSINTIATPFFGSENGRLVQRLSSYLLIGIPIRSMASGFLYADGFTDLQNKTESNNRRNTWNQVRPGKAISATAYGSVLTLPFICRLLALTAVSTDNEALKVLYASILGTLALAFENINTACKTTNSTTNFKPLMTYSTFNSHCTSVKAIAYTYLRSALRSIRDFVFAAGGAVGAILAPLLAMIPTPVVVIALFAALAIYIETEYAIDDFAKTLANNIYSYKGQVCVLKDDFLVSLDSQMCPGYTNYSRLIKVFDIDYLNASNNFNASEKNVLVGHNLETLNNEITSSIVNRGIFADKQDYLNALSVGQYPRTERSGSVDFVLDSNNFWLFSGHGRDWGEFHGQIPLTDVPQNDWETVYVTGYDNFTDAEFLSESINVWNGEIDVTIYVDEEYYDATGYITIYFNYESEIRLNSLSVSGPNKTTYVKGETFDPAGLVVTAHYASGDSKEVDDYGVLFDPQVMDVVGSHQITVQYSESIVVSGITIPTVVETTFNIIVREPELVEIQAAVDNCQTVFEIGTPFNYSGLEVLARYEDGTCERVTSDFVIDDSEVDAYATGEYSVYVSYTVDGITKTSEYTVTYINTPLDYLELDGLYLVQFFVGDQFSYANLEVYAHYEDGNYTRLYDYDIDYSEVDMNQAGVYTVYISYTENGVTKTTSYQVTVSNPIPDLTSITLSGAYTTHFREGDTFNYDGLVVTAHYDNGTSAVVTNYVVDSSNVNMANRGRYLVGVIYEENGITAVAQYEIMVLAALPDLPTFKVLESITLSGNYKTIFKNAAAFNYDGLVVTAHYDNGTSKVVTNYVVDTSKVDFTETGTYVVGVFYSERGVMVSATYTILVVGKLGPKAGSGGGSGGGIHIDPDIQPVPGGMMP